MSRIHPVIMAGGRGTRFWPASRHDRPKQFLTVAGNESLLTRTGKRLFPLSSAADAWVVTSSRHVDMAARHLPEMPRQQIVGEPAGRNTAPCIALAAALVQRKDPDGVLVVTPADHWIADEEAFRAVMRKGADAAEEHRALVTFGITPTSPETGYGYIEAGDALEEGKDAVRRVARFTEKPDLATAREFLAGGRHFWNSGIFAWRADVFLAELEKAHADMADACREIAAARDRDGAMAAAYPTLTSISVDYAVLEKSDNVLMVPGAFPWSDVGSWDALADILPVDGEGNALEGDVLAVDAAGCFVRATTRTTAIVGVRDLVVVDLEDSLLVCSKERAQDVKKIVDALEAGKREELL